ncbi:MAG: phosphonate C-P lyase system protein PhnH [Bosea sp. (in: a-proteobacteria)]
MSALAAGFAEPVFDSQNAFRHMMEALATPGRVRPLDGLLPADCPLPVAPAALLLALCDFETPLWLAPSLVARAGVADFLRFHTGAPMARDGSRATFALLDLASGLFDPSSFAQGTAEYPDRSTTIIAICASVTDGPPLGIRGPGIDGQATLNVAPLPSDFVACWRQAQLAFPLGVDVVFASTSEIVGLPRTTRFIEGAV